MGEHVQLSAADGHEFDAYVARPTTTATAGLVVLQEAFGVNRHIRSVTDAFAKDGFLAVAPALFDRNQRGVELGYSGDELQRGIAMARSMNHADVMKDIAASLDYVRGETGKKAGVIGYCFGGSMAWLAATRLRPDAAVGYYGGAIPQYGSENPNCPVMLHFGSQDAHIPTDAIDKVQAAHSEVQFFWYDAGHGFDTADRASFNAEASRLARERSLEFLRAHLLR